MSDRCKIHQMYDPTCPQCQWGTKEQEQSSLASATCSIFPCDCGRHVTVTAASGGTRTEATMYSVECPQCGVLVFDCIPSNCSGKRADAIREWNRSQREKKKSNGRLEPQERI
jgi:hypothetical protein